MRLIGFSLMLGALIFVSACEPEEFYYKPCGSDDAQGGHAGNGGEGGGVSGDGGANAGGGGGVVPVPECVMDGDCVGVLEAPDPGCGALRCTAEQKCLVEITEGPIASQRYGDCRQGYCDGAGHFLQIDDSEDYFNDWNPCTIDFCQNGPVNMLLPDGSPCPGVGNGYCYKGQCVECVASNLGASCNAPGYTCSIIWCVDFAACQGGQCGGPCAPCPAGIGCQQNADCISGVCNAGMCALPGCADLTLNDSETGIDCGGPNCSPCGDGEGCAKHADCVSNVCMFGVCQAPSCFDGVRNGDEMGADCGGSACGACSPML